MTTDHRARKPIATDQELAKIQRATELRASVLRGNYYRMLSRAYAHHRALKPYQVERARASLERRIYNLLDRKLDRLLDRVTQQEVTQNQ